MPIRTSHENLTMVFHTFWVFGLENTLGAQGGQCPLGYFLFRSFQFILGAGFKVAGIVAFAQLA